MTHKTSGTNFHEEWREEIVEGGKRYYGQAIGIILYNTLAPRVPGDVGNAYTFDFPVRLKFVEGLDPSWIVNKDPDPRSLPLLIAAAKELESDRSLDIRLIESNICFGMTGRIL